jgi:hypothetical protein
MRLLLTKRRPMHPGSLLPALARNIRLAMMVLSIIGALLGLAASQAGAEPPTGGIGAITAVQGQVTVAHPQAANAIPANAMIYDDVFFKDIIETQDESRTKALFDDETLLTVGEHSRVEINEHIYDPSQNRRSMVVKLVRGTLRALISKVFDGSGSKFEIHTPTAVAAARGTYFVVWVQGELSGVVNIGASGRVDFTSAGQTVSLAPGQFSVALPGVIPTLPTVFGSDGDFTPPGLSHMTPGQSGTEPGKSGITTGQGGQADGSQDTSLLASVRAAINRTELRDTPRAVPVIPAVRAIPVTPGTEGTPAVPAFPATQAGPAIATPPAVISGAAGPVDGGRR